MTDPVPKHVDTIVVGAGPSGLAAVDVLSARGHRVLLLDEQGGPGGQIGRGESASTGWPWPERYGVRPSTDARLTSRRSSSVGTQDAFETLGRSRVHYVPGSTIIDAVAGEAGVQVTWQAGPTEGRSVEGGADSTPGAHSAVGVEANDGVPNRRTNDASPCPVRPLTDTRGAALLLATGAMERPLLFPGHTLPGVMTAGALQALMKQARLRPAVGGLVLAGQGPLLLLVAEQISRVGGRVDALLWVGSNRYPRAVSGLPGAWLADADLVEEGARLLRSVRRLKIPIIDKIDALRAEGQSRIERVTGHARGRAFAFDCRLLGIHDGVLPNTQLPRLLGLTLTRDRITQDLVPTIDACGRSSAPRVWITGDGGGIVGAPLAVMRGRATGLAIHQALSDVDRALYDRLRTLTRCIATQARARAWVDRLHPPIAVDRFADDTTILCRCEAVTVGQVRDAIAAGATGPNRVKAFTRCGMGACQGRYCHEPLDRLLRSMTDQHRPQSLRIRPPLKPVLALDYLVDPA